MAATASTLHFLSLQTVSLSSKPTTVSLSSKPTTVSLSSFPLFRRISACFSDRARLVVRHVAASDVAEEEAHSQANSSIKGLDKLSPSCLAFQVTALLTAIAEPTYAVTGVNYELDWVSIIIESGVCAVLYFLVAPPIIMNWLRLRWFKRNVFEMYLQFMFVFLFFPGVLLWAPFLNFRKFACDPSMKYPWSVPEDLSKIRNNYRKYPWATLEDYEV